MPSETRQEIPRGAYRAAEATSGSWPWLLLSEKERRILAERIARESGLAEAREKLKRAMNWSHYIKSRLADPNHIQCESCGAEGEIGGPIDHEEACTVAACEQALKAIDGEESDARD